ncbi:hypothetical protein CH352_04365 [Leptospira hartskeerlii]|uniref:Uncharacterized protein n=1 Tax=Leptospira hartskeerlii TaxID=2023177 RepID=A0A2M9XG80_9LEPT|nr:hypothetical protein [Leptospira hartskeerlii]PJZ26680.1 hypothetical protein CH357_04090 [Leptospira hartskeerlii]PJZ34838.1 hypothetical protein CH352_04365 [Leptospira hartskeerlii]
MQEGFVLKLIFLESSLFSGLFIMSLDSWISGSDNIRKEIKNPYASGCIFVIGILAFGVFGSIASLFFGVLFLTGEDKIFPGFGFFFCISLVTIFIITMRSYRKASHIVKTIEIQTNTSLLSLRETGKSDVELPLSEFISYMILFRMERSNSSGTTNSSWKYWDIFLLYKDGSCILLETFRDPDSLKKGLEFFKTTLPLPVWDRSDLKLTDPDSKEIPHKQDPKQIEPSPWVKTGSKDQGTKIEIIEPKSAGKTFITILVPALFYGAWFAILNSFFGNSENLIFLIFFIPFSVFFLGIVTVMTIFSLFKKTEVIANSLQLKLRYSTRIPILSSLLYKERSFPLSSIRNVRTIQMEKDNQILCVALKSSNETKQRSFLDFLYNIQGVNLSGKQLPGDTELLGIITLGSWLPKGPGYSDLVYAENVLESVLNLKEESLSFSDLVPSPKK